MVLVPKVDGTWRFCVNFQQVNTLSKFDTYPLPCIDELLNHL